MATVQLSGEINILCGIMVSADFDTLTWRSVHPASPVLLTRNGPLVFLYILKSSFKKPVWQTDLQFENRLRAFRPQGL